MTYKDLAAQHSEQTCRRFISTHMNQDLLYRRTGLEMECAEDGKVVSVNNLHWEVGAVVIFSVYKIFYQETI